MRPHAMKPLRSATASRRRLVWLLWLALLLPMAQLTANWHSVSHVEPDTANSADEQRTLPLGHCGLCLTAAAISGGALPSEPPAMPPLLAARHDVPQAALDGVRLAFSSPAYLSRAPPDAPH